MSQKLKKKLRIGMIFGGRSGEHEVSLVSAASIMQALDKLKYKIVPIGITKEGRWIAVADSLELLKSGRIPRALKAVLPADPTEKRLLKTNKQQTNSEKLDVIFPVLHGPYGEDGTIQGLLEMANIPYVGAGVLGSAVGMDKVVQKQLFEQAKLPVVKYVWFLKKEWDQNQKSIPNQVRDKNQKHKLKIQKQNVLRRIEKRLSYPCFVKPANLGSSVGISKAHNRQELIKAINEAVQYDRKILIEQGIEKTREIEVSVLGNDDLKVSLPGEIIASNEFYDYDAKYVDGKSKAIIPAKLPQQIIKKIQEIAKKAFGVTNCSGMARVDFLVQDPGRPHTFKVMGRDKKIKKWQIFLSELNTIPGFTSISMYPKLWQASGLPYSKLIDKLIELAIERHQEKNKLKTSYQPKEEWYRKT